MLARLATLIVLVCPTLAFAWGGEGHQLVALIAEDQLTPQVKAVITELLDGANISDAEVVNWADEVRRQRQKTAPWHYTNIPYNAATFDRQRDGRDGDNVVDAIEARAKILADKTQPREKRQEALKFVIHFVGDLHQPLHCANRDGDKGENTRLVMYPGQRGAEPAQSVGHVAAAGPDRPAEDRRGCRELQSYTHTGTARAVGAWQARFWTAAEWPRPQHPVRRRARCDPQGGTGDWIEFIPTER